MSESTKIRAKRDFQIAFLDLGGAHTYAVAWQPGDFNYSGGSYEVISSLDLGDFTSTPSLRKGNEQAITGGFTAYFRDPGDTASGYATLLELTNPYAGRYVATNWVSTLGASADVLTLTLSVTIDGSFAGEADKTLTFAYCVVRGGLTTGDPSTIPVTFTSYQSTPTLS